MRQTKYQIRLVSIHDGMEKWNISLNKNDVIKFPKKELMVDNEDYEDYDEQPSISLEQMQGMCLYLTDLFDFSIPKILDRF